MCMDTFLRLPEEKRTRFLDAAWEEFTRVGFAEASINQIVHRAGIPRGSFYQYFTDKQDLFNYLMGEVREHFVEMYCRIAEQAKGDIFQTQLLCFDHFVRREREADPLFERCLRVMRLNPGIHMQLMVEGRPGCRMLDVLYNKTVREVIRNRSYDQQVLALALLSLAAAMMDSLVCPDETARLRQELEARLEVIKYGALTDDRQSRM